MVSGHLALQHQQQGVTTRGVCLLSRDIIQQQAGISRGTIQQQAGTNRHHSSSTDMGRHDSGPSM